MTPAAPRSTSGRSRRTRSSRRRKTTRGRRIILYGAATAVAVLLGVWAVSGLFPDLAPAGSDTEPRRVGRTAEPGDVLPENTAVLFYVGEDGTSLVEHEIEIPLGDTTLARARLIAERELGTPEPPLLSPFPEGTTLRAIYITPGGDAFVDLSSHVSTGHPGGSLDELFTVYALVNSLTRNIPEIAAVQILIEGHEVDTLAGHVDLRRPLGLNMAWVSRAEAAEHDASDVDEVAENS